MVWCMYIPKQPMRAEIRIKIVEEYTFYWKEKETHIHFE